MAATAYEEKVDTGRFVVTGDHGPEPLVFELGEDGLTLRETDSNGGGNVSARNLGTAAAAASPRSLKAHSTATGFGLV
jgi:hypothetical protein